MTYSKIKQLTDSEKKLQILRNQLYGKQEVVVAPKQPTVKLSTPIQSLVNHPIKEEVTFLRQDLMKIMLLASVAIMVQIILYLSLNLKLLKF